jgi:hypothetical protein
MTEGNTWNLVPDIQIPYEKRMQRGVRERSDFVVPCSGVETFLCLPRKPHQHVSHHKTLFRHVNAISKSPATDVPDNHQEKVESVLLSVTFPS